MKTIVKIASLLIILSACNKEGQGGTSVIEGQLISINHSSAKAEIFEITFTNGVDVEHGDYWLINSPTTNNYFYIWYNNPTWVTNGNPNLANRTGIEVAFNYSDSNVEITTNTMNAIMNATNLYSIDQLSDILRITNNELGETPDASDFTSPFDINIEQQGKNSMLGNEVALVGEKIFITYGGNTTFNDNASSGPDGDFSFNALTKGDYKLEIYSKDTISGEYLIKEILVNIPKNKSIINVGAIKVFN